MRLDVRTRQLIEVAENALEHLERTIDAQDEIVKLVTASLNARRSRFDSYRVIIQGLQLSVAAFFALAAVYSLVAA